MAIKPAISPVSSSKVYGVDTDAYNPDGLLTVETVEDLAGLPESKRTSNLRVKVLSTNQFYKVDPENPGKFVTTTAADAGVSTVDTYTKAEIDAIINRISSNNLTKSEAASLYARKDDLEVLDVYSKAEIDARINSLSIPAAGTIYTKTEVDQAIASAIAALKAELQAGNQSPVVPSPDGGVITQPEQGESQPSVSPGEVEVPESQPQAPTLSPAKVVYWGVIPSENPSADDIKALPNSRELETLAGLEFEPGSEEDEGFCVLAYPTSVSATSPTFTNRGNNFTQSPLYNRTVSVDGVEYRVDVFEYSFDTLPFRLS